MVLLKKNELTKKRNLSILLWGIVIGSVDYLAGVVVGI